MTLDTASDLASALTHRDLSKRLLRYPRNHEPPIYHQTMTHAPTLIARRSEDDDGEGFGSRAGRLARGREGAEELV
jgi:hypothetical protein